MAKLTKNFVRCKDGFMTTIKNPLKPQQEFSQIPTEVSGDYKTSADRGDIWVVVQVREGFLIPCDADGNVLAKEVEPEPEKPAAPEQPDAPEQPAAPEPAKQGKQPK